MSFVGWLIGVLVGGVLATVIGVVVLGTRSVVAVFLLGLVIGGRCRASWVANYRRTFR